MGTPIVQVDAFGDALFSGNPAAVCLLSEPRPDSWMQGIAREMNLSETAFLLPDDDGFRLRWFTPSVEVELCGHATLASAHVLWERVLLGPDEQARFHTLSGLLTASRTGEWIEMALPAEPEHAIPEPDSLSKALGVEPAYVGKNRFDCLVEVESEEVVRGLRPDILLLRTVPCRGVMVTSRADSGPYDFVSRFFGPLVGVDEDPVTGSAHCCLGPYWAAKLGKTEMVGFQASARGGVVRIRLEADRVYLGGQAVTVFQGELAD
jgi:PhzF family phenazine biosynthesis protein